MACLASRESHAARRAGKGGSEVGRGYRNLLTSVFALFARAAHGAKNPKSVAALRAACRRATLRVQGTPGRVSDRKGAGVRHGIRHGRRGFQAWDAIVSAVAGLPWDWRRRRGGNDGAFPSRGAVVRIGTAFPAPLAANMRTGSRWRDGSPCGTATVLRNTSVGRRRTANDGYQREGRAS